MTKWERGNPFRKVLRNFFQEHILLVTNLTAKCKKLGHKEDAIILKYYYSCSQHLLVTYYMPVNMRGHWFLKLFGLRTPLYS